MQLERLTTIKDQSIVSGQKFTFVEHITDIVGGANKLYGFICRNCRNFYNIRALFVLFYSLFRSILEHMGFLSGFRCTIPMLYVLWRLLFRGDF